MKTILELQNEIKTIIFNAENGPTLTTKEKKQINRKITFLREAILYLERGFTEKQLTDILNGYNETLKKIYDPAKSLYLSKKEQQEYYKNASAKQMESITKTLKFILKV